MLTIGDDILERWLREDVPHLDLTSHALGIGAQPATITFTARENITVCGTEESARILSKLGAEPHPRMIGSGETAAAGAVLLQARGAAETLHAAWKVCANTLEYASGIATRTRALVDVVNASAPTGRHVGVAVTRKGFPGTRELATKAVVAGGGLPHRLGLSETILVFPQHRAFLRSDRDFAQSIPRLRGSVIEKKFIVEAHDADEARLWAESRADGIQFDKFAPDALALAVKSVRAIRPGLLLLAAGGVTVANAAAYAATGIDVLVTSTLFHGAPADIAVDIGPA